MMLNYTFCGKEIDSHSEGNIYACMRRMSRCKLIIIAVRILKFLRLCRK